MHLEKEDAHERQGIARKEAIPLSLRLTHTVSYVPLGDGFSKGRSCVNDAASTGRITERDFRLPHAATSLGASLPSGLRPAGPSIGDPGLLDRAAAVEAAKSSTVAKNASEELARDDAAADMEARFLDPVAGMFLQSASSIDAAQELGGSPVQYLPRQVAR